MPFCSQCGNEVSDSARFCRSCGAQIIPPAQAPQAQQPPPPPSTPAPNPARGGSLFQRPAAKWGGIGCAGLLLLFITCGIIGTLIVDETEDSTSTRPTTNASATTSEAPTVMDSAADPTATPEPTATPTPKPVASLYFCDDPASLQFLQAQNKLVEGNINRFDSLAMDQFTLQNIPTAAQDEAWTRNVLADVDKFKADGKQLASAGPVPPPATKLNKQFREVGNQMVRVADLMSQVVNKARDAPFPVSEWQPIANDAADAMNDLEDEIGDVQGEIEDECG